MSVIYLFVSFYNILNKYGSNKRNTNKFCILFDIQVYKSIIIYSKSLKLLKYICFIILCEIYLILNRSFCKVANNKTTSWKTT